MRGVEHFHFVRSFDDDGIRVFRLELHAEMLREDRNYF